MLCDSKTKHMVDAITYVSKSTKTNGLPIAKFYVKELSKSIHGTDRNVINWFTSEPLTKNLQNLQHF